MHCQVPVITILVTTTEIPNVITTTLENEEVPQVMTGTSLLKIEWCANGCDVDYKEEDETREEVLGEVVKVRKSRKKNMLS